MVYSLLVSVGIYREIKVCQLKGIILGAGLNTAIVMFVISTSSGFSWLVTALQIPVVVANAIMQVSTNPTVVLFMVNVLLLILGVVLETNAIILLVTPILLPLTTQLGIDPLLLGLIMVVNTSVGMITPPMAVNIFVASSIGGESIEAISRRLGPFLVVLILDIFIISYVPGLALWLPKRFGM